MRGLGRFYQFTFWVVFWVVMCLSLVACDSDGGLFEGVDDSEQSGDANTNEVTPSGNVDAGDDTTTAGDATTGNNPVGALDNSDLSLNLAWISPVGNNTVSGSPLITDAELIVTGGNFTEDASAQIKAFDTTGLLQPWPLNPEGNTDRIWAYREVAADPNGNIFALRLNIASGEQSTLVTRDASGQLLTDFIGGGGQLRSAPSIELNGRVVFTHGENQIAVRDEFGTVQLFDVPGLGTMRTKPAISGANIAYFTVEGDSGLVSINLNTGASSRCLGALPSWSSPAIAGNGNIIFGTTSGRIMACSESMTRLWAFPDDDLDAANAQNCNPTINDSNFSNNMSGAPVIGAANDIFIRSNDGFIYALNINGKLLWCHDTGVSRSIDGTAATPILVSSGNLIYVDENGVSVLDKITGELVTRLSEDRLLSVLNVATATPTITPSGLLVFRVATNIVAVQTNTALDTGAAWPKWGYDLRNSGLKRF